MDLDRRSTKEYSIESVKSVESVESVEAEVEHADTGDVPLPGASPVRSHSRSPRRASPKASTSSRRSSAGLSQARSLTQKDILLPGLGTIPALFNFPETVGGMSLEGMSLDTLIKHLMDGIIITTACSGMGTAEVGLANDVQAEERLDIEMKQRLENDFMLRVEEFTHFCFPDTRGDAFPEDVIPLAEACIFYESKCTDEWLHLAKYLLKDYLELRNYVNRIPEERLRPQLRENQELMRLLRNFHTSVVGAWEALDFVAKLPKLIHAKTSDWMTKRLLDPDLRYINKTAHLAAVEMVS